MSAKLPTPAGATTDPARAAAAGAVSASRRAAAHDDAHDDALDRIDPRAFVPLLTMHLGCLLIPWAGVSALAVTVALALLFLRAFGLTAGYHRYFSHRSFRTSRAFQLALAWLGASAAQLGPLWWAAYHRLHHRHSDTEHDVHSPAARGLWWAHMGWLLRRRTAPTRLEVVPDLARFPELRFLDRWHVLAPLSLAAALWAAGSVLAHHAPQLGTSAFQLLVWGFFVSTVALYHVTFAVNSLGHRYGRRDFATRDDSRNSFWLALLTLGDGWHNNHHRHPGAARHGLRWWQLDLTYVALWSLARLGVVWGLRPAPREATSAAATLAMHRKPKRSPTLP